MNWIQQTIQLFLKEVRLELRQKYAISGILLYVLSTVFIVYLAVVRIEPPTWNMLFWIVVLFASVNAVAKSFVHESSARGLYYYVLAEPSSVITAKIIYNTLLLMLLSLLSLAAFSVVADNPIKETASFFLILFLGSMGFSVTMTFISAIATKTNNSATIMTILTFPVIVPILMLLMKLSAAAIGLLPSVGNIKEIMMLLAIDTIAISLVLILFPYLWRE